MEGGIHTVLKIKEIAHLGIFPITNTMLTSWILVIAIGVTGYFVGKKLNKIPSNTQTFFEMIFSLLLDYLEKILESRALGKRFFPFIATLFIFILISNWFSLIPGVGSVFIDVPMSVETNGMYSHPESNFESTEEKVEIAYAETLERIPLFYPISSDLNFTLTLAILVFIGIAVSGISYLGVITYIEKCIIFSSPIYFFRSIVDFLLELTRLVSLSLRMFENLFTRKTLVLLIIMVSLPFFLPLPSMLYEVFVGFIQASFFSLLTVFLIKVIIVEPH